MLLNKGGFIMYFFVVYLGDDMCFGIDVDCLFGYVGRI